MREFAFSLPANLLLAGEYAVLEPGGLGVGVAIDCRLRGRVTAAANWRLTGIWPGGGLDWQPGQPVVGLLPAVFEQLTTGPFPLAGLSPAHIELDSTAFFAPDGRKWGFGSSAAAAAGLTAALAAWSVPELPTDDAAWRRACHHPAVAAHRAAQGGRGSGYDVTTSLFGGVGVFTGGITPGWQPLAPAEAWPAAWTFPGPAAIRTTSSITAYRTWQQTTVGDAADWLDRCQAAVTSWARAVEATGWSRALVWLRELRNLGLEIGQAIGVTAELPAPLPGPLWFAKALGAGNETGFLAAPTADAPAPAWPLPLQPLRLAATGLSLEADR